jgi:hypothetical protein
MESHPIGHAISTRSLSMRGAASASPHSLPAGGSGSSARPRPEAFSARPIDGGRGVAASTRPRNLSTVVMDGRNWHDELQSGLEAERLLSYLDRPPVSPSAGSVRSSGHDRAQPMRAKFDRAFEALPADRHPKFLDVITQRIPWAEEERRQEAFDSVVAALDRLPPADRARPLREAAKNIGELPQAQQARAFERVAEAETLMQQQSGTPDPIAHGLALRNLAACARSLPRSQREAAFHCVLNMLRQAPPHPVRALVLERLARTIKELPRAEPSIQLRAFLGTLRESRTLETSGCDAVQIGLRNDAWQHLSKWHSAVRRQVLRTIA